jgi:hypothetical protein
VLRVGCLPGAAHPDQEQRLVPGVDAAVNRLRRHRGASGEGRHYALGNRYRQVRADRRDDGEHRFSLRHAGQAVTGRRLRDLAGTPRVRKHSFRPNGGVYGFGGDFYDQSVG